MSRLYSSKAWQRLRASQLAAEPLCVYCLQQGIVKSAEVVDHIIPHKGDRSLFFDADNLQSLCKRHHDSTKQKEERRGGALGHSVDGIPNNKSHHWNK